VKAVLVDAADRVVAQASAPLAVSRPRPGWSEQDPADWWAAPERPPAPCAPRRRRLGAVAAIGLSGQMHGATLLGADDGCCAPRSCGTTAAAPPSARRSSARCPQSREITGNLAMPGFTAPKLLWVRAHEPEVFARVRRVLLPRTGCACA
jgi:xylulokinase